MNVTGASTFSGLTATGLINSTNNLLTFGTQGAQGSSFGSAFQYADNSVPASSTTVDSMTFVVDRYPGSWLWEHNTSAISSVSAPAMRLDSSHSLLIFPTGATLTTPASITMTPAASPLISLGTATLTATGTALSTNGALTVGGNITNTTGSITGGASGLTLNAGGTNQNVIVNSSGTGDIVFNAGGAERARIKSAGNMGIGTTTPGAKLSLGSDVTAQKLLMYDNGNSRYGMGIQGGELREFSASDGHISFGTISTADGATWSEKMRIDTTGSVGIGTPTPQQKLDVTGMVRSQGSQLIGGGQLEVEWLNNGDGFDQKLTELIQQTGQFTGRFVNDAYTAADNWLIVKRNTGTYSVNSVNFPAGNVGIGTTTPAAKLHVEKDAAVATDYSQSQLLVGGTDGNKRLALAYDTNSNLGLIQAYIQGGAVQNLALETAGGNVGIGTTFPIDRLQISNPGDVRVVLLPTGGANNRESLVDFWSTFDNYPSDVGPRRVARVQAGFDGGVWGTEYMAFGVAGATDASLPPTERMRITATGNVGIGTANPTQKLSVAGTVRAYEVIVDTGWSDYVFDESYKLKTLSETEAYIKTEKHLPGLPSAKEVAEHGVKMGEMESKLLAKVEELTLHLIAQEKELSALREQVAELKATPTNSVNR